jgi:hypothetical protein
MRILSTPYAEYVQVRKERDRKQLTSRREIVEDGIEKGVIEARREVYKVQEHAVAGIGN